MKPNISQGLLKVTANESASPNEDLNTSLMKWITETKHGPNELAELS